MTKRKPGTGWPKTQPGTAEKIKTATGESIKKQAEVCPKCTFTVTEPFGIFVTTDVLRRFVRELRKCLCCGYIFSGDSHRITRV